MKRAAVFAFSRQGCKTARRIAALLCADYACGVFAPEKYAGEEISPISGSIGAFVGPLMKTEDALVFVGACGIAVRAVAPHVCSKTEDPAVVCVDERGRFAVSLLSGHIGGGNRLTNAVAAGIGAVPVITTATDVNGRFAVDAWAAEQGFALGSMAAAKDVAAAILERDVPICAGAPIRGMLPAGFFLGREGEIGICVSVRTERPFAETLAVIPRVLTLGLGCRRGTAREAIEAAVRAVLKENGLDPRAVQGAASIDLKADEPGLLAFCEQRGLPVSFYTPEALAAVPGEFTPSAFVQGVTGVDNVCERSAAAGGGTLIVKKTARQGVTVAVAEAAWEVNFG